METHSAGSKLYPDLVVVGMVGGMLGERASGEQRPWL